jgi:deoxyxylulose-5-phosphate synthase
VIAWSQTLETMLQSIFGYKLENNEILDKREMLPIGKGCIIRRPGGLNNEESAMRRKSNKDRVAILSNGTRIHKALVATNEVEDSGPTVGVMVADGRYTTPLDVDLGRRLAA